MYKPHVLFHSEECTGTCKLPTNFRISEGYQKKIENFALNFEFVPESDHGFTCIRICSVRIHANFTTIHAASCPGRKLFPNLQT